MAVYYNNDVTLQVDLGLGSGPLAASPSWTNVAKWARSFNISRKGRRMVKTTFTGGTLTVTLDNRDDRFDPSNTSSPYSPDLEIGLPIRIVATYSATPYTLFYGHIDGFKLHYPEIGRDAYTVLTCVDNTKLVKQYDLAGTTYSAESTDTRIGNVLDDVGWPAGARNLATGLVSVAASTIETESALAHLQRVEQAEQGSVFIARDGDFTFYNRIQYSGGPASGGTYGPANLNYSNVELSYDDDQLYNRAAIKGTGDDYQTAEDATSIADHGPRTFTFANGLMTDPEALGVAEWIVGKFKDQAVRISNLVVKPEADPTNLWPKVLALDLRDAITVAVIPRGGGDTLSQLVVVEGVTHDVSVGDTWKTTVMCRPLSSFETADYWILGTSDDLDTNTILA